MWDQWEDLVMAIFFSSSVLARKLNKRTLQFPPPALLPNFEQRLPYFFFVGDEEFPLSHNLIRNFIVLPRILINLILHSK
jgi:hypothetical protein